MDRDLSKIDSFLQKHHTLSLATFGDTISACTLFYVFDKTQHSFVVASEASTTHAKNVTQNPKVAGTVALETKIVGRIEGVQFGGKMFLLEDRELKLSYFRAFPYALAMKPTLWQIKVEHFKLTDNRLGFGKKIIWQAPLG